MTSSKIPWILAAGSVVAFTAAVVRWRGAAPPVILPRTIAVARSSPHARPSDSTLDDAENLTVSNDPFRLSNEPAAVRYDPATDGVAAIAAVPVVRPTLVLKAIIGGPPWQAVIDGLPGQPPGTIAAPGTRFDKLLVRSVSRDSVVVQGPDTTWALSFKGRM